MAKFKMTVQVPEHSLTTSRLGSDTRAAGTELVDEDLGKLVKLAADSRYDLCAEGDPIQGRVVAVETAMVDGYTLGTVQTAGRMNVICDGLEATVGTGTIAVGDFVVCGTVVAAGTALTVLEGPQVAKATYQPDETIVTTVAGADTAAAVKTMLDLEMIKLASARANALYAWRVVSLGVAGAVGDTAVIERVALNS